MEITAPLQFGHAGQLPARYDTADPRSDRFNEAQVDVDLRACEFIRAPAALWCVVYLGLASRRGSRCRLLVPDNKGVCVYLKSIGFFEALRDVGVDVDDRGIGPREDQRVVLPITRFATTGDAADVTNRTFERIGSSNVSAANLTRVVTELFSELALNAVQHSESPIGAFGSIQFQASERGQRFACAVADGGIGVRAHLCRNPALRTRISHDWDALELAVRERVSGTGDPHRGIGLYGVSEDVRLPDHSLLLHSGLGSLEITEDVESAARRTRLFPGTLASLAIPG